MTGLLIAFEARWGEGVEGVVTVAEGERVEDVGEQSGPGHGVAARAAVEWKAGVVPRMLSRMGSNRRMEAIEPPRHPGEPRRGEGRPRPTHKRTRADQPAVVELEPAVSPPGGVQDPRLRQSFHAKGRHAVPAHLAVSHGHHVWPSVELIKGRLPVGRKRLDVEIAAAVVVHEIAAEVVGLMNGREVVEGRVERGGGGDPAIERVLRDEYGLHADVATDGLEAGSPDGGQRPAEPDREHAAGGGAAVDGRRRGHNACRVPPDPVGPLLRSGLSPSRSDGPTVARSRRDRSLTPGVLRRV